MAVASSSVDKPCKNYLLLYRAWDIWISVWGLWQQL